MLIKSLGKVLIPQFVRLNLNKSVLVILLSCYALHACDTGSVSQTAQSKDRGISTSLPSVSSVISLIDICANLSASIKATPSSGAPIEKTLHIDCTSNPPIASIDTIQLEPGNYTFEISWRYKHQCSNSDLVIATATKVDNVLKSNIKEIKFSQSDYERPLPDFGDDNFSNLAEIISETSPCRGVPPDIPKPNVVFVTSKTGNANFFLTWPEARGMTGIRAGDAICQSLAETKGLEGNFKAWLSDENDDAFCRIHGLSGKKSTKCNNQLVQAAGPWVRMDGIPFAKIDSNNEIVVLSPARFDENKVEIRDLVDGSDPEAQSIMHYFTGTKSSGEAAFNSGQRCNDWEATTTNLSAVVGHVESTGNRWTNVNRTVACGGNYRLLCFQTGPGDALPKHAVGKIVFVTSVVGNANLGDWKESGGKTGPDAGDEICKSLAHQAQLKLNGGADSFKAWLLDSSEKVKEAERFSALRGPWKRLDGIQVTGENINDLIDGSLLTSIEVNENGSYVKQRDVWTGINWKGEEAGNCSDWKVTSGTGVYGFADVATGGVRSDGKWDNDEFGRWSWTMWEPKNCNEQASLYCFQE
jgi:hypothetical protein